MDTNEVINSLVSSESQTDLGKLFPPLTLCSVVDSRFSSRRALVEKVRGSGLFETIVEPDNLGEAVGVLEDHDVDTCILGPSVSKRACANFLRRAKKVDRARECAFVVVTRDPGVEAYDPFDGDAHARIEHLLTSRLLWQEIARAVHTASVDELRGQRIDEFVEARIKAEEGAGATVESSVESISVPETASPSTGIVVSYLLQDNNTFRTLFKAVVGRDLTAEEAEKNVSDAAVSSIRELIQVVVARKGKAKKIEHFMDYLDDCVKDWLLDVLSHSEYKATKILRDKLLGYEVVAKGAQPSPE